MKDADYNKLINGITSLKEELDELLNKYSTSDLLKIKETDFAKFFAKAQVLQSKLDKFDIDLYHIIGMTKLSGPKIMILISKAKQLINKRAELKMLVSIQPCIHGIRSVKDTSRTNTYKVKFLDGLDLHQNLFLSNTKEELELIE